MSNPCLRDHVPTWNIRKTYTARNYYRGAQELLGMCHSSTPECCYNPL